MALADIPGYGAYAQRRQMNEQAPLVQLQQAQGAMGLMDRMREREQDEQFRMALARSGGDVEKALEIALGSGNVNAAAKLAPLAKLSQERKQGEETRRGLAALTASPEGATAPQPMELGAGQPVRMAGEDAAVAAPATGTQARISHLNKLAGLYATNPVVVQRIQAEIDKLQKDADAPPKKRDRIEGENLVQEEFVGDKWVEVGRGPRFARQVPSTIVTGEQGTKPPSGYRWKGGQVGGELEPIPGGPAVKPSERALPTSAAQKLFENQQNLRRAQQALALVNGQQLTNAEGDVTGQGDANATGIKGYLPEPILQRVDPKGVETRAAIADLGSLIIHDRSGAAVTAAEYPRLRPFVPLPTDDAPTVRKKLTRFASEYQKVVEEMSEFYRESGYKVPSETLKPSGAPTPAPAPTPASAKFEEGKVYVDAKGNKAKFEGGRFVPVQ